VPPDAVDPLLRQLVNQFVHDKARPEAVAVGLQTVRELCMRTPLVITEELLQVRCGVLPMRRVVGAGRVRAGVGCVGRCQHLFSAHPRVAFERAPWCTAMNKLRIVTLGLARGDRKWSLNEEQIPHFRGVRVHVSTSYNSREGNRRASRNGRVSSSHPNP
jgi:hypothetical protein